MFYLYDFYYKPFILVMILRLHIFVLFISIYYYDDDDDDEQVTDTMGYNDATLQISSSA